MLAGQSRFLDRITFSFDVLDVGQDQCLDLNEIQMVFAALGGSQQHVLFQASLSNLEFECSDIYIYIII